MLVHTLEHGRIDVQYKKGTPAADVAQARGAARRAERRLPHAALREHDRTWTRAVAATAWTHSLTCPEMNDKVFDAIRTFRARYIDKGPETVP